MLNNTYFSTWLVRSPNPAHQRRRNVFEVADCPCRNRWDKRRRNVWRDVARKTPQRLWNNDPKTQNMRESVSATFSISSLPAIENAAGKRTQASRFRSTVLPTIVAAATADISDAATSNSSRTAAAATVSQNDAATSRGGANRSPRTPTQRPRGREPGRKEATVTAGNKSKSSVPLFLHRPGSRTRASGRIRQNLHNLVTLLPSFIMKF